VRVQKTAWQAAAFLFVIVAGFYWKLTLTKQFEWMWSPDLAQQVLPWFEEEARQFRQGTFPLWDAHEWAGQPLLAQAQPGAAYPLNWLLFSRPPTTAGHIRRGALLWYYVIIHFLAAWFAWMLCRDLGRSQTAAIFGGLIYSLASFVGQVDWPQMVNGAVWAPLVFLFLLRCVRNQRAWASAALSGLFLGVAWLSGHHQVPIYTTIAAGFVWIFAAFHGGGIDWRVIRQSALSMLVSVMAGALQILPALEYGRLALRWANAEQPLHWNQSVPYYVHQQLQLHPIDLFGVLFPVGPDARPFIGIVAFVLALAGVILCWNNSNIRKFMWLALGGLSFALGGNSLLHGLLYAVVPMMEKARVSSMALFLFGLGIAVLASFGVDAIAGLRTSPWQGRLIRWTAIFGVVVYAILFGVLVAQKMVWSVDDRVALTPLFALLLAALLAAWRGSRIRSIQFRVLLLCLLLWELGNGAAYMLAGRHETARKVFLDQVMEESDIAAFLNAQPKPSRVEVATDRLALNWPEYHGFDQLKSYTASVTVNLEGFSWQTVPTRSLFGVRYSISEKAPSPEFEDVFTARSGLKVYRNPWAFPRAWTVHSAVRLASDGEGRDMVEKRLSELKATVFSREALPALTACSGEDQVSIHSQAPSEVSIGAVMNCAGLLVLSDTYYPGWDAWVDGKPARIHEVNFSMRGVAVPQGSHTVTFRYRPGSVYLGAAFSLFALLGTLALVVVDRSSLRNAAKSS
jgi:hypothetical protein